MAFAINSVRLNAVSESVPTVHTIIKNHDSHPDLGHLILLVFEAVMEVVCVSLPGYIIARLGHFDAEKQKFLANLNVMLFTPCLIFTKLASQLNADKLVELGIIPVIFVIQTLVSLIVTRLVARMFGFGRRASNFVTAMGVFGNSNSLPISLVLSLSQTLRGLHWDKIPGDNDDEVAARGILYLLIFQQLGQLVRWTWGFNVLLAPKSRYDEYIEETAEEGRYRDNAEDDDATTVTGTSAVAGQQQEHNVLIDVRVETDDSISQDGSEHFDPAGRTPVAGTSRASPAESEDEGASTSSKKKKHQQQDQQQLPRQPTSMFESFAAFLNTDSSSLGTFPQNQLTSPGSVVHHQHHSYWYCVKSYVASANRRICVVSYTCARRLFGKFPSPIRTWLRNCFKAIARVYRFLVEFMNPPLWAMLIAITVASVPDLQRAFFEDGSFIKNSVTSAIRSSGGVAVPLILVVLGANLARNTESHPEDEHHDPEEERIGTKLLVASLISRMVLPTLIMAPILAIIAKCVPVSILDDPIFIVVCFLLIGAPSALQLAQICQINMVFENVMARVLFQSYVIWILPSTLILVMCALEVLEWAK